MKNRISLVALVFWAMSQALSLAQFGFVGDEVKVDVLKEQEAIIPGEPFTLAFRLNHNDGWHTYWKNSGSVQQSPEVSWNLPEGFKAGELQWPVPTTGMLQGVVAHYYSGTKYLLVEITTPSALAPGEQVTLAGQLDWQHCDDVSCKQGQKKFSLSVPVAEPGSAAMWISKNREIFEQVRSEQLPQPIKGWTISAFNRGANFAIEVEPSGDDANTEVKSIYFLSGDAQVDSQQGQELVRDGDSWILELPRNEDYDGEAKKHLPGVLVAEEGWLKGETTKAFDVRPELTFKAQSVSAGRLLSLVGFAVLGGLILNLMPCVFPVIGIKIMGFVNQAGEDRAKVSLHGLVFAAGVLASFLVLAAIVFVVRATGEGLGWGFQLQEPWFVFALLLVMFVFAMNMAGVFEIGTTAMGVGGNLTRKSGFSGSFFSGVLATVVATPCSAPFLATALGAVMTLPAIPFFLVFTSIAFGLALPYLILSMFPALIDRLPRPGAWMESFKQGMSFLLFATAGFLIWVYGGLIDASNHLYSVIGLALIGFALWVFGRWSTPVKTKRTRTLAGILTISLFAGGVLMGYPRHDPLTWEIWSEERVEELVYEERPVYIDFTARWCVTCQTNKVAYHSKRVQELIQKKGIVLLKADWTNRDQVIADALARNYGETAIPVNVLYIPGEDDPIILPKILTPDIVATHFEKLPDATN